MASPVEDLNNADHRRLDQWKFFVVPEKYLPPPKDGKTDSITPGQLKNCAGAVSYKELAATVTKKLESLGSALKAGPATSRVG